MEEEVILDFKKNSYLISNNRIARCFNFFLISGFFPGPSRCYTNNLHYWTSKQISSLGKLFQFIVKHHILPYVFYRNYLSAKWRQETRCSRYSSSSILFSVRFIKGFAFFNSWCASPKSPLRKAPKMHYNRTTTSISDGYVVYWHISEENSWSVSKFPFCMSSSK